MILNFNTVFSIAVIVLMIFGVIALILASPGAKRPKHGSVN